MVTGEIKKVKFVAPETLCSKRIPCSLGGLYHLIKILLQLDQETRILHKRIYWKISL